MWAFFNHQLGIGLLADNTGNIGLKLDNAIVAFKQALGAIDCNHTPELWLEITGSLGKAYGYVSVYGHRSEEKANNIQQAIEQFQAIREICNSKELAFYCCYDRC